MDGNMELTGVHAYATTPYGHGDTNRGHSGIAGMKATSSRCKARSGKKISAAAAMHGRRRDLAGVHGLGPRGHGSTQNLYEMEEGDMGFSPKTENKDGDELEMAGDRKGGQRAPARIRNRRVSDRKRNTRNELQSRRHHHVADLRRWIIGRTAVCRTRMTFYAGWQISAHYTPISPMIIDFSRSNLYWCVDCGQHV
jgi:hypothetical protein